MKHLLISLLALLFWGCSSDKSGEKVAYQYIRDVQDKQVAVQMGSATEAALAALYPDMKVDRYETETDLVQALRQHRCEAIGLDGYAAHCLNVETGGGLAFLDDSLGVRSLAAAFPKNDQVELRKDFNEFIQSIKANGLHQKIVDKWIKHYETATMPDLNLPTKGTPIRVATCLTLPPTSYLQGKEPVGMDIELLYYFSVFINRPIELQNLNFTSLITSLSTGKCDMVMSSLSITEERAKMIDFSDSYYDYNLAMLVRNTDKKGYVPTNKYALNEEEETEWMDSIEESFTNNLIKEKRYEMVISGLKTTLIIAFFSAILGTLLGAFVCFLKMRKSKLCKRIANLYIAVMRGTPVLVLLLIMFYVVFNKVDIDPVLVSVITFALNFAAYVSEMFRTAIEGIDKGQTEAGVALGFSKFRTFYHIVLPQAFHNVLPVYKGELISMVKMTSIVGYIAVEDLTKVSDIIRSRTFDALFPLVMVAILYFLLAWLFGALLDYIGRKFNYR